MSVLSENQALQLIGEVRFSKWGRRTISNAPALAEKFGIKRNSVCQIIRGKTWGHLPRPYATEAAIREAEKRDAMKDTIGTLRAKLAEAEDATEAAHRRYLELVGRTLAWRQRADAAEAALTEIAFHIPTIARVDGDLRLADIEEVYLLKRIAADARAVAQRNLPGQAKATVRETQDNV